MDTVIVIPTSEKSNMSSAADDVGANVTIIAEWDLTATPNCTPLDEIDQLVIGIDASNTEFWGSTSGFWRPCFIVYSCIFYLMILFFSCICFGLMCYALLKSQVYILRTLLYSLILYFIWSTFSLARGILLIYGIASGAGSDKGLAYVAINLDIITSIIFPCIVLVALFSFLAIDSNIHFALRYSLLSTSVIYIEAIIMIIILFVPVGISVVSIFVILIILKPLVIMSIISSLVVVILFKHDHLSTKELLGLLWKDNKILLVIAFTYLVILYTYFLYASITIISNNDCKENIKLQRVAWLVFNCLLRCCEISISVPYFWRAGILVKEVVAEYKSDSKISNTQGHRRSVSYNFSSKGDKPVGSINFANLEEQGQNCGTSFCTKEIVVDHLPHDNTPNLNIEIISQSMSCSTCSDWPFA